MTKGLIVFARLLAPLDENFAGTVDNLNRLVMFPARENGLIEDFTYVERKGEPHDYDPETYVEGSAFGQAEGQHYGVCVENDELAESIGPEFDNLPEAIGFARGVLHQRQEADMLDEHKHLLTVSLYQRKPDGTVENIKEVFSTAKR